jgi:hypothetical protein
MIEHVFHFFLKKIIFVPNSLEIPSLYNIQWILSNFKFRKMDWDFSSCLQKTISPTFTSPQNEINYFLIAETLCFYFKSRFSCKYRFIIWIKILKNCHLLLYRLILWLPLFLNLFLMFNYLNSSRIFLNYIFSVRFQ